MPLMLFCGLLIKIDGGYYWQQTGVEALSKAISTTAENYHEQIMFINWLLMWTGYLICFL